MRGAASMSVTANARHGAPRAPHARRRDRALQGVDRVARGAAARHGPHAHRRGGRLGAGPGREARALKRRLEVIGAPGGSRTPDPQVRRPKGTQEVTRRCVSCIARPREGRRRAANGAAPGSIRLWRTRNCEPNAPQRACRPGVPPKKHKSPGVTFRVRMRQVHAIRRSSLLACDGEECGGFGCIGREGGCSPETHSCAGYKRRSSCGLRRGVETDVTMARGVLEAADRTRKE